MLNKLILLADDNIWALGANVTLSGIAIVFLCLILLVLIIYLFSKVFGRITAEQSNNLPQMAPTVENIVPTKMHLNETNDDEELIAVIAAAVDALYSGSGKKAVIRSVRPVVGSGRPIWAQAGIMENTRSF